MVAILFRYFHAGAYSSWICGIILLLLLGGFRQYLVYALPQWNYIILGLNHTEQEWLE